MRAITIRVPILFVKFKDSSDHGSTVSNARALKIQEDDFILIHLSCFILQASSIAAPAVTDVWDK